MELATLQSAMIAAMKAKDKPRKDAISALVSAVKKSRNRCRMQRRYSDIYGRSGNLKGTEVCKRAD